MDKLTDTISKNSQTALHSPSRIGTVQYLGSKNGKPEEEVVLAVTSYTEKSLPFGQWQLCFLISSDPYWWKAFSQSYCLRSSGLEHLPFSLVKLLFELYAFSMGDTQEYGSTTITLDMSVPPNLSYRRGHLSWSVPGHHPMRSVALSIFKISRKLVISHPALKNLLNCPEILPGSGST